MKNQLNRLTEKTIKDLSKVKGGLYKSSQILSAKVPISSPVHSAIIGIITDNIPTSCW